jgi:pyridoxamine 5'-phosphate oxidase
MKKAQIEALREKYIVPILRQSDMDENVFDQFMDWFRLAVEAEVPEPNAMTLATVNHAGMPSARTVLFKSLTDRNGFSFYTNYESNKARDLKVNPFGSLLFCWLPLARQIRIEGMIRKVPISESQQYFHSRPRGSQIGAWVSQQSEKIESRSVLENKQAELEAKFKDTDVIPLPLNWGGYELIPNKIEFWQGNENRLHDRFLYEVYEDSWSISRLSP